MDKIWHGGVVGATVTTTSEITELIDNNRYESDYPSSIPYLIGFELLNLGKKNINIKINDGDAIEIKPNEGIDLKELVNVRSCKILTNGATVKWGAIVK